MTDSVAARLSSKWTNDPPPPRPDPPPLVLTLSRACASGVSPLPFVPGRAGAFQHGRSELDLRQVAGVVLNFHANCSHSSDVARLAIEKATDIAHARMTAVREMFRTHPTYARWRDLAARLSELKAKSQAVKDAPEKALQEARALLLAGQDPRPAEDRHTAAVREIELHRNRIAATTEAEAHARAAAKSELARLLDEERARIAEAAEAEARTAAAALTAAVSEHIEKLLLAHVMAGRAAANAKFASEWGERGGLASEYKELP